MKWHAAARYWYSVNEEQNGSYVVKLNGCVKNTKMH